MKWYLWVRMRRKNIFIPHIPQIRRTTDILQMMYAAFGFFLFWFNFA